MSGCFTGEVSDPYSGATVDASVCNSADAALNLPECMLTLGQWKQSYLVQKLEQDWYSVELATLDQRSIVHIQAGYYLDGGLLPDGGIPDGGYGGCTSANNTAVNLTVNVLAQDALTSLATASDVHGTACPTPMDITFSYSQSNTRLFLVLEDDKQQKVDTKNPYSVMADVVENPDSNEPNDTPQTATPITLTAGTGGVLTGQSSGYLATPGDVDYFSVQSPGANYVLWFEVSQDPSVPSPPPHRYRLEYYVYAPDGTTQVSQGFASAGSQYSASLVNIGTAILLNQAGPYYILVQGYRDGNTVGAVPGDLTFKYDVKTIVVPLQDVPEGTGPNYNNSFASAYPVSGGAPIAVGGNQTVTGRTSYVGDADWYAVTLGPNPGPQPSLLHYKLTPGLSAGRFPALPTNPNRTLFVYTTTPDVPSCTSPDAGLCVISAPNGSTAQAIAYSSCSEAPPKCLQSYRLEALPQPDGGVLLKNLMNFEANLQIPPHAGNVTYYFYLQATGDSFANNGYWADDKDYSILLEHLVEPDQLELIPDPPRPTTLAAAPGAQIAAVPVYLSYGLGQINPNTRNPPVIFGPEDYDGRGDDIDTYQVALPFATQEAWQISWSVPVSADGVNPDYDLGFTLSFCDNTPDAGTGTPPCYAMVTTRQSDGSQLGLAYSSTPYDSWWNTNASVIADQVVYTQTVSGGMVTTTVTPYGCFCFEPRFVSSGTSYFLMNLFPLNRMSWALVPYTVTTGSAAYPYSFNDATGTQRMCPATCGFTLQ